MSSLLLVITVTHSVSCSCLARVYSLPYSASPRHQFVLRVVVAIPHDIEPVFKLLRDSKRRKEWDVKYQAGKVTETIDDHSEVSQSAPLLIQLACGLVQPILDTTEMHFSVMIIRSGPYPRHVSPPDALFQSVRIFYVFLLASPSLSAVSLHVVCVSPSRDLLLSNR